MVGISEDIVKKVTVKLFGEDYHYKEEEVVRGELARHMLSTLSDTITASLRRELNLAHLSTSKLFKEVHHEDVSASQGSVTLAPAGCKKVKKRGVNAVGKRKASAKRVKKK